MAAKASTWRSSRPRSPTSTTSETARRSGIDSSPTCRRSRSGEPTRAAVERPAEAPGRPQGARGDPGSTPTGRCRRSTRRPSRIGSTSAAARASEEPMPPAKSSFTQIPTPTTAIPTPEGGPSACSRPPASTSSSPTTSASAGVFEGFLEKAEDAARENVNALARGSRTAGTWSSSSPPTRSCSRRLPRSALHRGRRDARERHLRRLRVRRYVPAGRRDPLRRARGDRRVGLSRPLPPEVGREGPPRRRRARRAGYAVDPLDSGCCGMAGSFGYESNTPR